MSIPQHYCTFRLDEHLLGVDLLEVQEIIRHQTITCVPLAPPLVRGLINLRGQIVVVIDLRRRLGLPPSPQQRVPIYVVVRSSSGALALEVDSVEELASFTIEECIAMPETVAPGLRELTQMVHPLPGKLLLVLDIVRIVDFQLAPQP